MMHDAMMMMHLAAKERKYKKEGYRHIGRRPTIGLASLLLLLL
jgi:hypothetical protein